MNNDSDALAKLDELLDRDEGLSAWEIEFLESLNTKRGTVYSEKQVAKLEAIWERVCNA